MEEIRRGEPLNAGRPINADPLRRSAPAGSYRRQLPSFIIIGALGYVIDASTTYGLVRFAGFNPLAARVPAFALATVVNFALNRAFTFPDSRISIFRAFVRYVAVCAVGLGVNYAVYAAALASATIFGIATPAATLPLFVALGSGAAMFVTFFGFRLFAFRS